MASPYFKQWITAKYLLENIECSIITIKERTKMISDANDFLESPGGMEKLDAACMQIIAIGEAVTKLSKIEELNLQEREPSIPWSAIKQVRNIISHEYFDVDAEEIFIQNLDPLLDAIRRIHEDIIAS